MGTFGRGEVEKGSSIPIYSQVERMVMEMIDAGLLASGQRAPSERKLAEQLGISRMTVRAALSNLIADGFLYSVPGKGTFVADPKLRQDLLELTSFTQDMQRRGLRPGSRLLDLGVHREAPAKVYQALGLPEEEELVRLHRLRTADDQPMCLETSYLPGASFSWLLGQDFESKSLYKALEDHGVELIKAEEHLEATSVREAETELLTIPVGSPALLIERTTYTMQEKPVEYVKSLYRGDRYRFSTILFKRKSRKGGGAP